ncbi:ERI1 exoribonuclease 3 [Paragonimus westermani]|uniref:ERI1 exoribonuclease 3 n=1 Tax=Paragonimus westermani TaxID=34504 RepID=A0A5J4NER1_9TREM|nr:ERI1 exoribonuclease 3 [Paragonimus westermani]
MLDCRCEKFLPPLETFTDNVHPLCCSNSFQLLSITLLSLPLQEIIEFPVVKVNAQTLLSESEFHHYVRPVVHPELTDFCTELTGIIQDMVECQPCLEDVLKLFDEYLLREGLTDGGEPFAFVTCGDWDLKTMLPSQCRHLGIPVPLYFRQWINLKQVSPLLSCIRDVMFKVVPFGMLALDLLRFARFLFSISRVFTDLSRPCGSRHIPFSTNDIKGKSLVYRDVMGQFPFGMLDMLSGLGLPHRGRHHSGIDDARNIVNILCELIRRGAMPTITCSLPQSLSV